MTKRTAVWPLALWLLTLAAVGCGPILERHRAADKFRAVFGCAPERVAGSGTGYRVEGCGVTAYLQCFDDNRDYRDPVQHALLHGDDTCMIERSERRSMPTLEVEPRTRVTQRNGQTQLRTSLSLLGARITLIAAPERDGERVVVIVRPLQAKLERCDDTALWIEGDRVPLEGVREVRNQRGHEVQFAVQRTSLTGVEDALRVALHVCGHEVTLDDATKKAFALFEMQFREQLAQGPGASPVN